jgi:hypothetical protein
MGSGEAIRAIHLRTCRLARGRLRRESHYFASHGELLISDGCPCRVIAEMHAQSSIADILIILLVISWPFWHSSCHRGAIENVSP